VSKNLADGSARPHFSGRPANATGTRVGGPRRIARLSRPAAGQWYWARTLAVSDISVWDLQTTEALFRWLRDLGLLSVIEFIRALPVGILAVLAVGAPGGARMPPLRVALVALVGVALMVFVLVIEERRFPVSMSIVLSGGGSLLGAWLGGAALRGSIDLISRCGLLAAAALALSGVGAGLGYLALERTPLPFSAPAVTSEGQRHLYHVLQTAAASDTVIRRLRLTTDHINFLIAWGLSMGSPIARRRSRCCAARPRARLRFESQIGGYRSATSTWWRPGTSSSTMAGPSFASSVCALAGWRFLSSCGRASRARWCGQCRETRIFDRCWTQ